jgi:hypothetical protein
MLFNDTSFVPERPKIAGGAVKEMLGRFDPGELLSERDAAKFELQWNSIRCKFSVAYSNWPKSGQADPETFPSFT